MPFFAFCMFGGLFFSLMLPADLQSADNASKVLGPEDSFCINYSAKPSMEALQKYKLCIFEPSAEVDLGKARVPGHHAIAYLSLAEVHPHSPSYEKAKAAGLLGDSRNELWGSDHLNVTAPDWQAFVLKELAEPALEKGFDGWFLDTADSIQVLQKATPSSYEAARAALIHLIQSLRKNHPDKIIVLNRGFFLLDEVADSIDALLIEGVFQSWHIPSRTYVPVSPSDREWLVNHINRAKEKHLPVLVVDYVDPKNITLARKTAEQIAKLGCIPFISTPDLSE